MFIANGWKDYQIIDTGGGEKPESWKGVILRRPDPQAIWQKEKPKLWDSANAIYHRSQKGGGRWEFKSELPGKWEISYRHLKFHVRPTGFKHTGLFPEQAVNWDWLYEKILSERRTVRVLNLFAYTGAATLACLSAGAEVVQVDAAKSMTAWAKENAALSGLSGKPARYIVDDCIKFVMRERRRGSEYDAVIMDPPSYGRGVSGEVWKIEKDMHGLVSECSRLLSKNPLFFVINSYTTGLSAVTTRNMLILSVASRFGGKVGSGELCLPVKDSGVLLPCGTTARWER